MGIALVRAMLHSEQSLVFPSSELSHTRRVHLKDSVASELRQLGGIAKVTCFRATAPRGFFFHGNESSSCQRFSSVRGGDRRSVRGPLDFRTGQLFYH